MSENKVEEVAGRLGRWWCEGKGSDGRGFEFSHVDSEAALCTRTQTENFDWLTSLRNHIPLFSKLFAVNIAHTVPNSVKTMLNIYQLLRCFAASKWANILQFLQTKRMTLLSAS